MLETNTTDYRLIFLLFLWPRLLQITAHCIAYIQLLLHSPVYGAVTSTLSMMRPIQRYIISSTAGILENLKNELLLTSEDNLALHLVHIQ